MKPFVNVYPDVLLIRRRRMFTMAEWDELQFWCQQQGIQAQCLNHWSEGLGTECYSFRITNLDHHVLFLLRWA